MQVKVSETNDEYIHVLLFREVPNDDASNEIYLHRTNVDKHSLDTLDDF